MNIVLSGSLGNIGSPLSQTLVLQGHAVTVISSNPEKKAAIANTGAIPAVGSLADTAFLTAQFKGADAVCCIVPPDYQHPDQLAYYQEMGLRSA